MYIDKYTLFENTLWFIITWKSKLISIKIFFTIETDISIFCKNKFLIKVGYSEKIIYIIIL